MRLNQPAEIGADVLAERPVNSDVAANCLDKLAGDVSQGLVTEHLHRAVVGFQCVVEGQLVL